VATNYPWYALVRGDEELLQGDLLRDCPIVVPPADIAPREAGPGKVEVDVMLYDVVVMSQSCDLVQKKVDLVLVCPFWPLSQAESLNRTLKTAARKENLRQGRFVGYVLLDRSSVDGFETDYLVVDFRSVFSVPFDYIVHLSKEAGERLRLLPPYREHLAQAFARFFMRVGLPAEIPAFV
jgi:hypothetical protein